MLRELLGRSRRVVAGGRPIEYDEQKRMVADRDPTVRSRIAAHPHARPEILYLLAKDAVPEVRQAVAGNEATPAQADLLLAEDEAEEVRAELALKIGRLIPDLAEEERAKVKEMTIETLETLARDQLPRVRAILAEELKHSTDVPRDVLMRLARDLHQIVHAPVLEYSPLLSDTDLMEIIAAGTVKAALQAIARRQDLSGEVSEAVAATLDIPAVAQLLANKSAKIRGETLEMLADNAAGIEGWHEPMVMRTELSMRAIRRISGFVAASLLDRLTERNDLDELTATELSARVQQRIRDSGGDEEEEAASRVRRLQKDGLLDEETVLGALEDGDRSFVMHAVAVKTGVPYDTVDRLMRTRDARVVTALAWQAKLSMRAAMRLQQKLARVPPQQMLHARNGTDFPLTPQEMTWQIQAFT